MCAKFARPNSYNGKQATQNWTGQARFATEEEAMDGESEKLIISPATLSARLTSAAVVGPAASPQISNSLIGKVIFSGVSIAAGLSQSFTITNNTVLSTSAVILAQIYGATDGAALNIKSVTPSVGSFVIAVSNGTGATTSIANLTVVFQVLS